MGEGTAIYVGTHLDAAALEDANAAHLLVHLVEQAGVRPPLRFAAKPDAVDCHLLQGEGAQVVVLTNNSDQPAEVQIEGMQAIAAHDLLQNQPCDTSADGIVRVQIAPWGGAAVAMT